MVGTVSVGGVTVNVSLLTLIAVAVPAVLGYNWLLRRNKSLQDSIGNFAGDLHAYLVGGARVESGTPARK